MRIVSHQIETMNNEIEIILKGPKRNLGVEKYNNSE